MATGTIVTNAFRKSNTVSGNTAITIPSTAIEIYVQVMTNASHIYQFALCLDAITDSNPHYYRTGAFVNTTQWDSITLSITKTTSGINIVTSLVYINNAQVTNATTTVYYR